MGCKSCEAMHVIAVLGHVPQEQQSRDAPGADIDVAGQKSIGDRSRATEAIDRDF